ncbi:MAG: YesL family protein [Lachnospiraceae bacterium]|nr:YesL family protein [Lachnospiraceae bacterium]
MRNIFSPDSLLIKALTLLFDLMYLNLLFLLCSIPIFTIGAAATALYAVLFQRIRGKELKVGKTYFAEFKSNFKQATLFWIPFFLIVAFLSVDVYISHNILPEAYRFLQYPVSIALFIILWVTVLVFPQMALFNSPTRQIIKNSAILSIVNFPIIGMVFVIHIFLFLLADLSAKAEAIVVSILLFFGIAALAWFFCIFYRRIFIKVMGGEFPEEKDSAENNELLDGEKDPEDDLPII